MKLTEQEKLELENIWLKAQILINQVPFYSEIISYKQKEIELQKKVCERLQIDINKVEKIDYTTGEVTVKEG